MDKCYKEYAVCDCCKKRYEKRHGLRKYCNDCKKTLSHSKKKEDTIGGMTSKNGTTKKEI